MANTAPGYLTTPRGQVAKYIYYRSNRTVENPDYIFDAEATGLQGTDELQGVIQATLNNLNNANFKTYGGNVLTYNPITDRYDIKPGEYVL
jgi:hypothetical protein